MLGLILLIGFWGSNRMTSEPMAMLPREASKVPARTEDAGSKSIRTTMLRYVARPIPSSRPTPELGRAPVLLTFVIATHSLGQDISPSIHRRHRCSQEA